MYRYGKRPRILTGLALATLLAAAADALPLPSSTQIKTAFGALDTSRNRAISTAEWDQASFALFRAADKDGDEFIDRVELQASGLAPDTFLRTDLDRDDRLSVSEFTDFRRALFATADIDRDDFLSAVEFELFIVMERVGWQDTNRNGRIEMSELLASLLVAFGGLDRDVDTELSEAEVAYMRPATFKRYDVNLDGKLSRDEFIQGYRTELISG